MIKYYLVENYLSKSENKFMALVSNPETRNLDDIITHMIDEGTGLTRPQALAYFERLMQAIGFWIQNGYAINTPLVKFRSSISGSFKNENDNFDPLRHQLNIRATPGFRIKAYTSMSKIERTKIASQAPIVYSFTDNKTSEENVVATPGAISILRGLQLSFDKQDPAQGVFLKLVDSEEPPVRVEFYSLIKPQYVHFLCPPLADGDYTVEVRSLSNNGKEMLTGTLKTTLTVG